VPKVEDAMRKWAVLGAVNGLLAVLAGAFATHGLKASLSAYQLGIFEMASQYQMYLAFAFFATAWLGHHTRSNPKASMYAEMAGWAFLVGIILFCGSLYILGATGSRALVFATPLGGLSLIIGWVLLIIVGWHFKSDMSK
jgi:uncharacterized membrane protein YgdD (TMEM256/DUF423 family)